MKYPKINSLWKRVEGKGALIPGDYAVPEIGNVKRWYVQEKIDGTNIRINFQGIPNRKEPKETLHLDYIPRCVFGGRTDNADVPSHLQRHLNETFTFEKLQAIFPPNEDNVSPVVWLFGEGYGPKIQKGGGNYRPDAGFILFDCYINGWWLKQEDVFNLARQLDVPYAPFIGIMTEQEIVEYVKSKPLSLCSETPQIMEGVIARPEQLLLLRNGDPLVFKLKVKDI